jgi:hypothetical protein
VGPPSPRRSPFRAKAGFGNPVKAREGFYVLLLRLLVDRLLPAPIAKFLELYFSLHFLFIFFGPIIRPLAFGAVEFYKSFLTHIFVG